MAHREDDSIVGKHLRLPDSSYSLRSYPLQEGWNAFHYRKFSLRWLLSFWVKRINILGSEHWAGEKNDENYSFCFILLLLFAFAFDLGDGVFRFLYKCNFLRINFMAPPPSLQFIDLCLSSTSTFFMSSTLMYFIFFCLHVLSPIHTWPVCHSRHKSVGSASRPAAYLSRIALLPPLSGNR